MEIETVRLIANISILFRMVFVFAKLLENTASGRNQSVFFLQAANAGKTSQDFGFLFAKPFRP